MGLREELEAKESERDQVQKNINYYRDLYDAINKYSGFVSPTVSDANKCMGDIIRCYITSNTEKLINDYNQICSECDTLEKNFSTSLKEVARIRRLFEDQRDALDRTITRLEEEIRALEEEENNEW